MILMEDRTKNNDPYCLQSLRPIMTIGIQFNSIHKTSHFMSLKVKCNVLNLGLNHINIKPKWKFHLGVLCLYVT